VRLPARICHPRCHTHTCGYGLTHYFAFAHVLRLVWLLHLRFVAPPFTVWFVCVYPCVGYGCLFVPVTLPTYLVAVAVTRFVLTHCRFNTPFTPHLAIHDLFCSPWFLFVLLALPHLPHLPFPIDFTLAHLLRCLVTFTHCHLDLVLRLFGCCYRYHTFFDSDLVVPILGIYVWLFFPIPLLVVGFTVLRLVGWFTFPHYLRFYVAPYRWLLLVLVTVG